MDNNNDFMTLVMQQYCNVVDLYKHEDDLNWRKLSHLFYVNASIWIVIGFIIQYTPYNWFFINNEHFLYNLLSVIGIIICTVFGVAIWNGLVCLKTRKAQMRDIEEAFFNDNDALLLFSKTNKHNNMKNIVPTSYVLIGAPIAIIVIWVIFMFLIN